MTYDEKIKELKKELERVEKEKEKERWEEYLNKLENFLRKLKGKCILKWTMNGQFVMFKVDGYKEQYYAGNRNGFFGNWHPSRYFEIKTSRMVVCSVANDRGDWFRPGISVDSLLGRFKIFTNKKGVAELSKLNVYEGGPDGTCDGDLKSIFKIGLIEYENNSPNHDKVLDYFMSSTFVIPEEIIQHAVNIHNEHVKQTKEFWLKYEQTINNLPRLKFD